MLIKRTIAALVVVTLLAGCAPVPAKDGGGQNPQTKQQSSSPDSSSDIGHNSSGGGGGFGNIGNIDPRALLAVVVIVVVVVSAVAIAHLASETIDYIQQHTKPAPTISIQDHIYHSPRGLFSVAIPGEYPAQGPTGIDVRQIADQDQEQVFFLPTQEGDPVYSISTQPLLSGSYSAMSLDDFASQTYHPPISSDPALHQKPLQPLLDEKLTLDGKPALFREYSLGSDAYSKKPVYYLLYFVRNNERSALLSISWLKDCPKCSTGPETDIRAMDPHLKQFVESFHLVDSGSGAH
jgi:hypothetical protein